MAQEQAMARAVATAAHRANQEAMGTRKSLTEAYPRPEDRNRGRRSNAVSVVRSA